MNWIGTIDLGCTRQSSNVSASRRKANGSQKIYFLSLSPLASAAEHSLLLYCDLQYRFNILNIMNESDDEEEETKRSSKIRSEKFSPHLHRAEKAEVVFSLFSLVLKVVNIIIKCLFLSQIQT